jgi:hypothetical protein
MDGKLAIDDAVYVNVDFVGAELIYMGGVPPTFQNCTFSDTTFNFSGSAGATLMFLRSLAPATTNMREVVYGLIPELKD